MGKIELLESLMKKMWDPFYKTFWEKSEVNSVDLVDEWKKDNKISSSYSPSKSYCLEAALEINDKYPVHLQRFPNGDFMRNFDGKRGETSTKWVVGKTKVSNKPWYVLVIDLDFKESWFDTMWEYWKYIIGFTKNILPSFVVMSDTWTKKSWWFHLYYIIDPAIRERVNEVYGKDISKMVSYLSWMMRWWDTNPSRFWPEAWIRMPLSKHWKTWKPIQTILFKPEKDLKYKDIVKNVIEEPQEIDYLNYLSEQDFIAWNNLSKKFDKEKSHKKKLEKDYWIWKSWEINSIPFSKVIKELKEYNYDRAFSIRDRNSKIKKVNWYLEIDWININIREKGTDILYPTDWYIFNKEENYINSSFSWKYHPDRPQWNVLPFLKFYFENDSSHVEEFLFKHFGVAFKDNDIKDHEDVLWHYESPNNTYSITATQTRVVRTMMHPTKKKWVDSKTILDCKLDIIARSITNVNQDLMETSVKKKVFMVRNRQKELDLMFPVIWKKEFNRLYQSKFWFFLGDDNDIWMMFEAIESIEDIKEVDLITLGWYYEDWSIYYLWNEIKKWKNESLTKFNEIIPLNDYKQISVEEYYNKLKAIVDDRVAILIVLSVIIAMWMNALDEIKDIVNVAFALFVNWETMAGKSTLMEITRVMRWFNIWDNSRMTTASRATWTTAKPFKEACSQREAYDVDEYTNEVKDVISQWIRDILNWMSSERWTASMYNIKYNFRSPLFLSWERWPEEESVVNRMLMIYMKKEYQKTSEREFVDKVVDIKSHTCYMDILLWRQNAIKNKWYIRNVFMRCLEMINKKWVTGRSANTLARILLANYIVKTWVEDEEVIDALLRAEETSGKNSTHFKSSVDPAFKLKEIIMKQYMERKCIILPKDYDEWWATQERFYEIMFTNEKFMTSKKSEINDIISNINNIVWNNCVTVVGSTMLIRTRPWDKSQALDFALTSLCKSLRITNAEKIDKDSVMNYRDMF